MLVIGVPQAFYCWSPNKKEFVNNNPCNSWSIKHRLVKIIKTISNYSHHDLELTYHNCTSVLLKSTVNLWDSSCCVGGFHTTVGSRKKERNKLVFPSIKHCYSDWEHRFIALPLLSGFVQKFCSLLYLEKRKTRAISLTINEDAACKRPG